MTRSKVGDDPKRDLDDLIETYKTLLVWNCHHSEAEACARLLREMFGPFGDRVGTACSDINTVFITKAIEHYGVSS